MHKDPILCGDSDAVTALICPWIPHQIYPQTLLVISAKPTQNSSLLTSPLTPAAPLASLHCHLPGSLQQPLSQLCISSDLFRSYCLHISQKLTFTPEMGSLLYSQPSDPTITILRSCLPLSSLSLCHSVTRHMLFLIVSWSSLAGLMLGCA